MQLHDQFGPEVVAVSLNVDYSGGADGLSDTLRQQVLKALQRLEIRAENFISRTGIDEVLRSYELFSLPAVVIYDQQGNLRHRFEGTVDYDQQVIPAVQQLLGAAGD